MSNKGNRQKRKNCHKFLIRFYGTHFRLQLFSLPLQDVLSSEHPDSALHLDIIWAAFTGATDMLKLTSRHSSLLYFAQDSIHVMTAYSAAFLVKVRVSSLLLGLITYDLMISFSYLLPL